MMIAASLLIGPWLLGSPPMQATARMHGPVPSVQLIAESDTDRSTYTQKAQDDMHQWGQRVHDFGTSVKTAGKQGADVGKHALDAAYDKARTAADGLKTTGKDGWENAKSAFEKAKHDLAETWDRVRSQ